MKNLGVKVVCILLLGLGLIHAKTVLAAVELNSQGQIELWLDLALPTYEHIAKTAIAELEEKAILSLRDLGFNIRVIDHDPWTDKYYICRPSTSGVFSLSDHSIWQKNNLHIIKISEKDIVQLYSLKINPQPLRRNLLPGRYWRNLLEPIVIARPIEWDPFIQSIVDQVDTDSLTAYIQRLQDFKTRLTHSDSSFAASQWLYQKMTAWGYAPEFDSFYVDSSMAAWGYWPDTGYERNVIATLDGVSNPSKIMIICGHFDAIVWWDTALARINAPGADDNATGTVAALEAARIFSNYSWEPTIEFIAWATEELGLYGSYHYARKADSLGYDIGGVVNGDMLGYMDDANLDCIIQRRDSTGLWLSELYERAGELYVSQLLIYPSISSGGSDWYPFAFYGFPSVGAAERSGTQWNPYYHDTTDKITTLDPNLYTAITKAEVATLAILGTYPGLVENVAVLDLGNGSDLAVNWSANNESDIIGYNIYWGRISQTYTDSIFISGASTTGDTLTGLLTDSTYYVIVTALDSDDHESYGAYEKTGIPRNIPFAPTGVAATPISQGIRIDWQPNQELDLDGYRIYRRINNDPTYDSLNIALLSDTTYTDTPLGGENKYYYVLRAFDLAGNYSPLSQEAYGRPITLDQHILMVDETRNGGGFNPPDSLQDQFYAYVLQDYPYTEHEYGTAAERPIFADFVPYSTVLWHADDYSQLLAFDAVDDIKNYLDVGGNLWLVGWKATANFADDLTYPASYSPGNFVYDYLKISQTDLSTNEDSFAMAIGQLSYPDIAVDSARVPISTWGGTMRMIEAIALVPPAESIYTIDMLNNSSPFEGELCGLRYLGGDFKIAFFGFPLYYMDQDDARAAAQKVLDDFGEVGINEQPGNIVQVSSSILMQNDPNPFHTRTLINYYIPKKSMVSLKIYNISGQLIRTLTNGMHEPGMYHALWNSKDRFHRQVSSGVYFYQLNTDDESIVKKMIVIK